MLLLSIGGVSAFSRCKLPSFQAAACDGWRRHKLRQHVGSLKFANADNKEEIVEDELTEEDLQAVEEGQPPEWMVMKEVRLKRFHP